MENNRKSLVDSYRPVSLGGVTLYLPDLPEERESTLPPSSWNAPKPWFQAPATPAAPKPAPARLRPPKRSERAAIHTPMMSRPMDVAVVYVGPDLVVWSLAPDWSPMTPAEGPRYHAAARANLAGQTDGRAHRVIRDLLNRGVQGVVVYGTGNRWAYVTRPPKGGSIRTAWADLNRTRWNPTQSGRSREFDAAKLQGHAGIETGVEGLKRVIDLITPRDPYPRS